MFINPKKAIDEGWLTGIVDTETQIQPNALDFTLDRVFEINGNNDFVITEDGKKMRGGNELEPIELPRNSGQDYFPLGVGAYDGLSDVYVKLPEGIAAMVIIRSSFNRNGVFITSGLYDSGYQGHIGFCIHNYLGLTRIGVGTRIGQLMLIESDSEGKYVGKWSHEPGTHWS